MIDRRIAAISILLACLCSSGAQAQVSNSQVITGLTSQIGSLSSISTAYSGAAQITGSQINTNNLNQLGYLTAPVSLIPSNGSLTQMIGGSDPTAVTQSAINVLQASSLGPIFSNASAALTGDQIASGSLNIAAVSAPLSTLSFNQTLNTSAASSLTATNLINASTLSGAASILGNGNRQISTININDMFANTTLGGVFTLSQSVQGAINMTAGNSMIANSISGGASIK